MDQDQNQRSSLARTAKLLEFDKFRIPSPDKVLPTPLIEQESEFGLGRLQFSPDLKRMMDREMARRPWQRFFKRLLDVFFSAIALVLLAPLAGLIIFLIRLDSRGPAYFSQIRVGIGGQLFRVYKFRTMIANAEELKNSLLKDNEIDGPVFKIRNDPRVTRVGRFLRKTSLDELPQLWNVLIGDMSLVGPRPALPSEVVHWEKWQYRRLVVEQGCTCIWQVSGRNNLSFKEWMRLDMEYVYNWSILLDIRLIIQTVWVMITGRGAY